MLSSLENSYLLHVISPILLLYRYQTNVLQLIDVILEIPMTSDLDTSVLFSIFGDISKILVGRK